MISARLTRHSFFPIPLETVAFGLLITGVLFFFRCGLVCGSAVYAPRMTAPRLCGS